MKLKSTFLALIVIICSPLFFCQMGFAAVSAEEAAKLQTTLTPLGAERAGNNEGTIPAWDGGLITIPPGYKSGDRRPDPFPNEKPLFSITAQNVEDYADKLNESTKFMLKKYQGYRLDVYPTQRTMAAQQFVYDNTFKNATRAKTTNNGLSIEGAYCGIPFPIPKDGFEVIWNHLLLWKGEAAEEPARNYIVSSDHKVVLVQEAMNYYQWPYYFNDVPIDKFNGEYQHVRQGVTAPPFKAGETILVKDPVDMYGKGRQAWQYLIGQRRIRRAPQIAYDTPDFNSSGQSFFDEVFVFNGALDRYDWKLIGKKEMYIPYNCNKFYLGKDNEVIGQEYLNPDYVRWELHRVWVVEANLAPGKRHVVAKRIFYIDEDSWNAVLVDGWDGRGKLWRLTYSLPIALPELPGVISITCGCYDLQANTRTLTQVVNEMPVQHKVKPRWPDTFFTPDALAGSGVR